MDLHDRLDDIALLERAVEDAREVLADEVAAFVEEFHPLKVGDVVPVTGHPYKGKDMVVESISCRYNTPFSSHGFTARGSVLKKDKTPSVNRGEWFQVWEKK